MASINKLSIRGVRAFSPEDVEQVVEFYFPCTIIVGENGCGKTTIIEALKYAITGAFPPGCGRSGNAFVHDPKSMGQTTVKANVKLRFTSRSAQSMVVVRSMELTQKKTKATFKQLDGVLRMMDPETGERVSLSHKCSELDKQLPQLLGVSKPILEHVVFCHQEDASWPLQEGAVLKKRFDDIFDSTKYSKALVVFRQTEKEFLSTVKDLKIDLAGLQSHKHAAAGFRKELEDQNLQIEAVDEQKAEIEQAIRQADAKMEKYGAVINQVDELNSQIEGYTTDLDRENSVIKKQKSMLEDDMTKSHSLRDLKAQVRDFEQKMSQQVKRKEDLEAQVEQLNRDIEKARQEEMNLTSDSGKLAAEKEAHEKRLRERYHKMETMAQKYGMDLTQISQQSQSANASLAATMSQSVAAAMDDDNDNDTATLITITNEDMTSFFEILNAKGVELRNSLKESRSRFQAEEDKITNALTEVGGKLKAIENDKIRLCEEKRDLDQEMKELKAAAPSRTRRADVEDVRRRATKLANDRDELNKDPRRQSINLEIRQIEEKMDHLKRKIDDENVVLESLKLNADAQNSITTLREQCAKELDALDESMKEEAYTFSKFSVDYPKQLPRDEDTDGDGLSKTFEALSQTVREKFDESQDSLRRNSDDSASTQRLVSEKSALLTGSRKGLATVKSKLLTLAGIVSDVKETVADLRRYESKFGNSLNATEDTPRDLISYLDERLEALEEDVPDMNTAIIARKILKRLRKMAKIVHPPEDIDAYHMECPCCRREMKTDALEVFIATMKGLSEDSPLVQTDHAAQAEYNSKRSKYQDMRKEIESKMDDLRDFRRLTGEASELEKEIKRLTDDISHYSVTLRDQNERKDDSKTEVDELRELLDTVRRWSDDAGRVAEKKLQIRQKVIDLSSTVTDTSRDLKTVDRVLTDLKEEKDTLSNKTNRLIKEMADINTRISEVSNQASQVEKLAREKEERYAAEIKATDRKKELAERMQQIGGEEKKLSDLVAPLRQQSRKHDESRSRTRHSGEQEEKRLRSELSQYEGDVHSLENVAKQIDLFSKSSKLDDLAQISSKVDKILGRIDQHKKDVRDLQPSLDSFKRAVDDQERHKKQLTQNIDILEAKERIQVIESELVELEKKREAIEGHAYVSEEYAKASESKAELLQKKARTDGVFASHVEQIRALKRKLATPEYKDVDHQYKVAMIKCTTTKTAADDLKKYGNALDKALLTFHGVKIAEINKIIRELWMMTYKGEDITSIELQSGQEPGSKASKSYNYRVVMTKGGAKMDMRGRCSAGQRVLSSIVIRLALAETFGVNCGVIALDEPTVNLDYNNKKGLAVALAHIVASRASQRNFQLIMITHDEEFVALMKTELSSLTGFSMPEKYFQVSREESADGKFYSKINAVDWDELPV